MTPLSPDSITAMPMHNPDKTMRIQNRRARSGTRAASARKNIPAPRAREPRPQQTLEKMLELRAMAMAARTLGPVDIPKRWKKIQAQTPRAKTEIGARNLE